MKITAADYALWSAKNSPTWAAHIVAKQSQSAFAGVHACINARARTGSMPNFELDSGNLVSLLVSVRRRTPDLRKYLKGIATSAGTLIRPERRSAYARKWLARLERSTVTNFAEHYPKRQAIS